MKRILKALLSSISVISVACLMVGTLGGYVVMADETTSAVTQTKKNLTTEAKNLYYGWDEALFILQGAGNVKTDHRRDAVMG
ncbi:MAG: hypothetical protein IJ819_00680 [Clostridiales bacterium]|nr:hypothetical protein [Clostridiales bacterium]